MKYRMTILSTLSSILLIIALYFVYQGFFKANGSDPHSSETRLNRHLISVDLLTDDLNPAELQQVNPSISNQSKIGVYSHTLPVVHNLLQSKTAIEFEMNLQELSSIEPPLANDLFVQLQDFCSNDAFTMTTDVVNKMRDTFCQNYSGQRQEHLLDDDLESYSFETEVILEDALRKKTGHEKSSEDKADQFTEMVISARFPEDIEILKGINIRLTQEFGQLLWDAGLDAQRKRYPEANLINAQTVALTLYRCSRFGGCAPNNYYTILYCYLFLDGNCRITDSVQEMLYNITPQSTYNLATEIFGRLL